MRNFLLFLFLNLFLLQFLNAQNCGSDSVVVREYYEYHSATDLLKRTLETSVFNLDSGTVRISTQNSLMGSSYSPALIVDTIWVQTDTVRNTNTTIDQIYSRIGSASGWINYKTENFQYDSNVLILSKTKLSWNGSAWDSVSLSTWNYDVQNRLIETDGYQFSAGVRNNLDRCEIVYSGGQPYSKTYSSGIAVNQWEFVKRLTFTYTGNLRTNVDVEYYDSGLASWQFYGHFDYSLIFGEYTFILPQYTPIVLNGISSSDTLLTGYDTLEEITYNREVHFTAIDTTDPYFGVQGALSYKIYNHHNNQILQTSLWSSSWAAFDLTDSTWYSVDRPYQVFYSYDQVGRYDTIMTYGACTNPCGGEQYFLYDSLGRPTNDSTYSWTMVSDHTIVNTYYYSDSASLSILVAPIDNNVSGCPGATFRPDIIVMGGCRPYTFRWSPANGLSSDTVLQPDISIDSAITYTLTVHDQSGRTDSVNISLSPGFSTHLVLDSVYCNGNTAMHLSNVSGTFQWYLDSLMIPGAAASSFTATDPGAYHLSGVIDVGNLFTQVFACSLQSDTVTVESPPVPALTISDDTIFTNLSGIQYDWYLNQILLSTTTDSFFIINQTGYYEVTVTLLSGCSYTSDSLHVLSTGIAELEKSIAVFPNPVHDKLMINLPAGQEIIITDLSGKNILESRISQDHSLDVSSLPEGIYFLQIHTESGRTHLMIMKM